MGTVVGRDRELERIAAFLDLTDGEHHVLLVEGEAGIGKTTLWRAAVDDARHRGHTVLACAAAGSEMQLSFTAIRDLLGDVFEEIAGELPTPQRRALGVTLLLDKPEGRPPEPGAIGVAVLTALRALAGRAPTLIAIDDVQWLDPASATALSFVVRRLGSDGPAVLLARRTGDAPGPLELPPRDTLEVVALAPLTVGALARILRSRLDVAYPRPTLNRLHEVSGGNPFFAIELARALGDAAPPFRPGDPLPVPGSLRELLRDRLTALPPDTLDALAVAASLASPSLPALEAVLEDPVAVLAPAQAAQVVDIADGEVRFVHPLYSAAVYELASATRRREIHARLAGAVDDLEERARHLALASEGCDEEVAQIVEQGARTALARGSPAVAADLARRARRLTPPDRIEEASRRALAEVDYEFAAGDTTSASAVLAELVPDAEPGPARARLLSRQARLRHFEREIDGSVALLRAALAEAGDDQGLRGEIEEGLAWGLLLVRTDLDEAAGHARSAVRLAEQREDEPALAEALAAEALTSFVLGGPWLETMERARTHEQALLGLRVLRYPSFAYGYCLSCADELDRAREVFEELLRSAAESGDESSMPSILNHLTLVECLAGRWLESDRHAEEGYERALESGQRPTQVSILAKWALLEVRRGLVEEARATALRSLELAVGEDFDPAAPQQAMARGGETAIWTLGLVELWLGHAGEADRLLGPMTQALLAAGIREPGEVRCLPDEIEALVLLDRLDEAEVLLGNLEQWAHRLQRPSVLATAGRCRGLVHAAQGDSQGALEALTEAAAIHAHVPMPFEAGRTFLALGTQQRRDRRRKEARETLQEALTSFESLGAPLWAERARKEMARIGGRRAHVAGELTPSERRIAELVAGGKTNKEVAAVLVVADRTVESALTQIYRKLDVRSRTELARKFAGSD